MREDLNKKRMAAAAANRKSNINVEIVGVPKLESPKTQAQKYERAGWGNVE